MKNIYIEKYFIGVLLIFYFLYSFIIYEIKMYFLKDTLFIHQLWGVYETFYKNHKYYPVGQDELLKSISDEENPGLKTKMIFFRCTALVKNDTLYIYEYGFNKKNDNLSPYIDNLNNITFLDMLLHKKADILFIKRCLKPVEMKEKYNEKPIPPLKQ